MVRDIYKFSQRWRDGRISGKNFAKTSIQRGCEAVCVIIGQYLGLFGGASIVSVVPVFGTVIGAAIGANIGALAGRVVGSFVGYFAGRLASWMLSE